MNNSLISVIVALYKVEAFLPKCIESILNQTYRNFELILVNDGSPDNSLNICNKYVSRDSRIKVLSKENGGQSTARNYALDVAKGEYIGFIDGDDWVEPEMYQTLYDVLIREKADIAQCGWYKVESTGEKINPHERQFCEVYSSDEGLDELIQSQGRHLNTSVCCKLFKREIACKVRFSPVRAYEDDEYIFKTVSLAKKIVCIDTPLYDYLNRENSTMTSAFNINKLALITIQRNICELLKVRYPKHFPYMQKVLCSKQFYILNCLLYHSDSKEMMEEAIKIETELLSSYAEYMSNFQMGVNRFMLFLIKYSPKFFWRNILKIKFS